MGKKIVDISHHQGTIDFSKAKAELDLAVIRVQYGSKKVDTRYKEYVAGCKAHGIPFGHYAYTRYVSVADAIVEAKDFMARADKDAKFLVADVEEMTLKNPKDIIPATQAFIDTCKAGGWKVGLYTGHSFYKQYGMSKVKADFLWIPRYVTNCDGTPHKNKPDMACDLWQFTEKGKLAGVKTPVDLNVLNGNLALDYFVKAAIEVAKDVIDIVVDKVKEQAPAVEVAPVEPAKPLPKVTSLGDKFAVQVKAKADIGVYKGADISGKFKTLKSGTVFSVYGYTYAAWAVPGGFVQMKDVEPVAVTIKTGGLNPTMEADFRTYLKKIGLDGALNLAKGGNPSATITASGLDLVKVRKFLDEKGWYYK